MRRAVPLVMIYYMLLAVAIFPAEAEQEAEAGLTLGLILPVFVRLVPSLPPAVRFDGPGSVHLAWFEKRDRVE